VAVAGADFVKTSSGIVAPGATVEDVKLLYEAVDGSIGVKASGGIRTFDQVMEMIQAGAARIGTSAGRAIVEEAKQQFSPK
jgi:deoxyribose-phosphate aldolase